MKTPRIRLRRRCRRCRSICSWRWCWWRGRKACFRRLADERVARGLAQGLARHRRSPRVVVNAALLIFLALVPVYAALAGDPFAMTLFSRILIMAIAALSLNLIMGFGGMVSFGHAAYLGIGGYAVGILAKEGIGSGFVQWPVAIAASALYALGGRRAVPAHPRRLFHHDHARFRADGLLRRQRARPLRRRRRPDHLSPQPVRRVSISTTRRCSTICASACCWRAFIWSGASSIRASVW